MYNPLHVQRHKAAACVSEKDAPVVELVNPKTDRRGRIVMKNSNVYVMVLDAEGLPVTKFKRRDNQGGFLGALSYLGRVGYKERG